MSGKFVYSSYWHSWSRVLHEEKGQAVEINLTTNMDSGWERVQQENIRKHSTARSHSDRFANELPADAVAEMKAKIGEALTERLLTFDYLPGIDWEKYNKICNGGAAYEKIKKDEVLVKEDNLKNDPNEVCNLLPFIFARATEESQKLYEQGKGNLVVKDWLVVIALPDFRVYDSRWMCDPDQGDFCLVPDVDISFEKDHIFATFEEARNFVGIWWVQQLTAQLTAKRFAIPQVDKTHECIQLLQ